MPTEDIPITFDYHGKQYSGTLSHVQGAGATSTYHLYINKYFRGTLSKVRGKWVFHSQKGSFEEFAELFGKRVDEFMKH